MILLCGVITGAILWPALFTMPAHIARWLCQLHRVNGRMAVAVATIISFMFSILILLEIFIIFPTVIESGGVFLSESSLKDARSYFFASSLLGYFILPFVCLIGKPFRRRQK